MTEIVELSYRTVDEIAADEASVVDSRTMMLDPGSDTLDVE